MAIPKPPPSAAHLGQGVAYPLAYDSNGRLRLSWGNQSVADAMSAIFQTEPGERVMQPDNGAAVGVHEPIRDASELEFYARKTVAEHEPRVNAESISIRVMQVTSDGKLDIEVTYQIVGEATAQTLTFPYWTLNNG